MTYSDEKHIDYIIDNFNFDRVWNFMQTDEWIWSTGYVPNINQMKSTALDLLMRCKDKEAGYWISTGGFIATHCGDYLKLDFSLETLGSESVNLTDTYERDKKTKERKEKLEVIDGISS